MCCLGVPIYNYRTIVLTFLLAQFIRRLNCNCMCSGDPAKRQFLLNLPDFIIISILIYLICAQKNYLFTRIPAAFHELTPYSLFFLVFLLKCTQEYSFIS